MWEYEFAQQRTAERVAAAEHDRLVRSVSRPGRRARHRAWPARTARTAPVAAARPVSPASPEVGCRRAAAFSGARP